MRALKARAARAAAMETPLLILGETGTGKELIAHACHRASARDGKPFLALNCAAASLACSNSSIREPPFSTRSAGGRVPNWGTQGQSCPPASGYEERSALMSSAALLAARRPWASPAMRSACSSRPIESRTRLSLIPATSLASADMLAWVMVTG